MKLLLDTVGAAEAGDLRHERSCCYDGCLGVARKMRS